MAGVAVLDTEAVGMAGVAVLDAVVATDGAVVLSTQCGFLWLACNQKSISRDIVIETKPGNNQLNFTKCIVFCGQVCTVGCCDTLDEILLIVVCTPCSRYFGIEKCVRNCTFGGKCSHCGVVLLSLGAEHSFEAVPTGLLCLPGYQCCIPVSQCYCDLAIPLLLDRLLGIETSLGGDCCLALGGFIVGGGLQLGSCLLSCDLCFDLHKDGFHLFFVCRKVEAHIGCRCILGAQLHESILEVLGGEQLCLHKSCAVARVECSFGGNSQLTCSYLFFARRGESSIVVGILGPAHFTCLGLFGTGRGSSVCGSLFVGTRVPGSHGRCSIELLTIHSSADLLNHVGFSLQETLCALERGCIACNLSLASCLGVVHADNPVLLCSGNVIVACLES